MCHLSEWARVGFLRNPSLKSINLPYTRYSLFAAQLNPSTYLLTLYVFGVLLAPRR
jgi:hypothetical protein